MTDQLNRINPYEHGFNKMTIPVNQQQEQHNQNPYSGYQSIFQLTKENTKLKDENKKLKLILMQSYNKQKKQSNTLTNEYAQLLNELHRIQAQKSQKSMQG